MQHLASFTIELMFCTIVQKPLILTHPNDAPWVIIARLNTNHIALQLTHKPNLYNIISILFVIVLKQ